jgi:hypothetical protein
MPHMITLDSESMITLKDVSMIALQLTIVGLILHSYNAFHRAEHVKNKGNIFDIEQISGYLYIGIASPHI